MKKCKIDQSKQSYWRHPSTIISGRSKPKLKKSNKIMLLRTESLKMRDTRKKEIFQTLYCILYKLDKETYNTDLLHAQESAEFCAFLAQFLNDLFIRDTQKDVSFDNHQHKCIKIVLHHH